MPNLNAIPNAVVSFLNNGTFTIPFTAVKKFYPTMERSDYKDLKVYVMLPLTKTMNLESRRIGVDNRLGVSLMVRKQVDKTNDAKMEEILNLCDEICDYLFGVLIPNTKFQCIDIQFDALGDLDDLEVEGIFTGAFTFTYIDLNR